MRRRAPARAATRSWRSAAASLGTAAVQTERLRARGRSAPPGRAASPGRSQRRRRGAGRPGRCRARRSRPRRTSGRLDRPTARGSSSSPSPPAPPALRAESACDARSRLTIAVREMLPRSRRRDEHLRVHVLERKLSVGVDGHSGEYQADPATPQECVHHSSRVLPAVCTPPDQHRRPRGVRAVGKRRIAFVSLGDDSREVAAAAHGRRRHASYDTRTPSAGSGPDARRDDRCWDARSDLERLVHRRARFAASAGQHRASCEAVFVFALDRHGRLHVVAPARQPARAPRVSAWPGCLRSAR